MYTLLGYFVPFLTVILQKATTAEDDNLQSCKCGPLCLLLAFVCFFLELLLNLYATNCKYAVFLSEKKQKNNLNST